MNELLLVVTIAGERVALPADAAGTTAVLAIRVFMEPGYGGDGGSVLNFNDLGSITGHVVIKSGDGNATFSAASTSSSIFFASPKSMRLLSL